MVNPDEPAAPGPELCQHCKKNPVVVRTFEEKNGQKWNYVLCIPCATMLGIGLHVPFDLHAVWAAYHPEGDILNVNFGPRPDEVVSTQFQDWLLELRDKKTGELVMIQINSLKKVLEEAKKLFKHQETGGAEWV